MVKSKTDEYKILTGIKQRCLNPKNKGYKDYGGKGIEVCYRWINGDGKKDGFECFFEDMGPRPSKKHSINRINNNGNYYPENCEWVTEKEQKRNYSRNRLFSIDNDIKCLQDWCILYNMRFSTVSARLKKGLDIKTALSSPPRPKEIYLTINNIRGNIKYWSKISGKTEKIIRDRLRAGWSAEKALYTEIDIGKSEGSKKRHSKETAPK